MTDLIISKQSSIVAKDMEQALKVFDEAAARFLATRNSDQTRTTYARNLAEYRNLASDFETDPLRADAIISYNLNLSQRRRDNGGNLANDTVRLKMAALQSFFSFCYDYSLTPLKPGQVSDLLTMPPAKKLSPRDILTSEEAGAMLALAKTGKDSRRNNCLIRVMLDGGLRVSEAINLKAQDIYISEDRHWLHVAHGKGDKARDIQIPRSLYDDLADFGRQEGVDITSPRQGDRAIFNLHRSNAWRLVERCANLAGIPKRITPHSLRHTHAHFLRLASWPIEAVSDRLGHASLETTKTYTRPAELAKQIALPPMPWAE